MVDLRFPRNVFRVVRRRVSSSSEMLLAEKYCLRAGIFPLREKSSVDHEAAPFHEKAYWVVLKEFEISCETMFCCAVRPYLSTFSPGFSCAGIILTLVGSCIKEESLPERGGGKFAVKVGAQDLKIVEVLLKFLNGVLFL